MAFPPRQGQRGGLADFIPSLALVRPDGYYIGWNAGGNTMTITFIADDPLHEGGTWQILFKSANGGIDIIVSGEPTPYPYSIIASVGYAGTLPVTPVVTPTVTPKPATTLTATSKVATAVVTWRTSVATDQNDSKKPAWYFSLLSR